MLKKFFIPKSAFERYISEADGDETDKVTVTTAPRKNRGTDYSGGDSVTVAPRANRGTDYTAEDDAEPETPEPEESTPTDYAAGEDEGGDEGGEDTPDEGGEDTGGDEGGTGDEGADGDSEDPDPESAEPTDYSDEGGGEGGDDSGGGDSEQSNEPQEQMTEEEKDQAMKKYHMYKRFVHLYNVIESYIERCRDVVKPDPIQNTVIKTVVNNLSDIYDNMFDYMTIKYKNATYMQVLIYFETVISAVRLNFELLRNNKIRLKQ